MKNKNMLLMVVAIGCGLVAAFLTARLGAKGTPQQDTVDVIVAKKAIPVGTLLEEKDFNDLLTKAPFPRTALPPDVIMDTELLKGKRAARTLRPGNYFAPADVSTKTGISVPDGMQSFSIRMDQVRTVSGFVFPGDRVDILAMVRNKKNDQDRRSLRILVNMLVIAVDVMDRRPEGGGPAIPNVQSVTLAVHPQQAKLLHTAEGGGGDLRLVLRPEGYKPTDNDQPDVILNEEEAPKELPKQLPTEQIVFAKKDIQVNTKITPENLGEFFELKSILAPAPARAVKDMSSLKDKFIIVQQGAEFPLMNGAISEKELPPNVQIVEVPVEKVVVKEVPGKVEPKAEPKIEPKTIVSHGVVVIGPTGQRVEFTFEGDSKEKLKQVEKPTKSDDKTNVRPIDQPATENGPMPKEKKPETTDTPGRDL